MVVVREELGGHDIFDVIRSIIEFLRQIGIDIPEAEVELSPEDLPKQLGELKKSSDAQHAELLCQCNEAAALLVQVQEQEQQQTAALVRRDAALAQERQRAVQNAAALDEKDRIIAEMQAQIQHLSSQPRVVQGKLPLNHLPVQPGGCKAHSAAATRSNSCSVLPRARPSSGCRS